RAAATEAQSGRINPSSKIIDSHLHVSASPEEVAAADKCPYFPGQEPTLAGHIDFLLQCIEEEGVEGDLIQPINHKFNHYLLTRLYVYQIKLYPTKFVGCCLANPVEDKTGIKQLEQLVLEITNEARELGVYVGFMLKVHVKLSALFRVSRIHNDFPFVVSKCGYNVAKEEWVIATRVELSET
ncbi:hypothetical protein LINPERHAP2_LOCUS38291, partial [Linum perenne]